MPAPAAAPPQERVPSGSAAPVVATTTAAALAAEGGAAAAKVAAGAIAATMVAFLAALRELHRQWLIRELAGAHVGGHIDDVSAVVAQEMAYEAEFARRSADRVAGALPGIMAMPDRAEREVALRQLLANEERYAQQRSEAMASRAINALGRLTLRRESPQGAFWQLGLAQNHTHGCLVMAGHFWPWAVLDRVHPPRHYGCTSSLHSFGEAIKNGWMTVRDVPDTATAIKMASGVVMEAEVAGRLLAELELREQLKGAGVDPERLALLPLEGV